MNPNQHRGRGHPTKIYYNRSRPRRNNLTSQNETPEEASTSPSAPNREKCEEPPVAKMEQKVEISSTPSEQPLSSVDPFPPMKFEEPKKVEAEKPESKKNIGPSEPLTSNKPNKTAVPNKIVQAAEPLTSNDSNTKEKTADPNKIVQAPPEPLTGSNTKANEPNKIIEPPGPLASKDSNIKSQPLTKPERKLLFSEAVSLLLNKDPKAAAKPAVQTTITKPGQSVNQSKPSPIPVPVPGIDLPKLVSSYAGKSVFSLATDPKLEPAIPGGQNLEMLQSYIGNYVLIETELKQSFKGCVFSVDPICLNILLGHRTEPQGPIKVQVVSGFAIKSIQSIEDDPGSSLVSFQELKQMFQDMDRARGGQDFSESYGSPSSKVEQKSYPSQRSRPGRGRGRWTRGRGRRN